MTAENWTFIAINKMPFRDITYYCGVLFVFWINQPHSCACQALTDYFLSSNLCR